MTVSWHTFETLIVKKIKTFFFFALERKPMVFDRCFTQIHPNCIFARKNVVFFDYVYSIEQEKRNLIVYFLYNE